MKDPRDIIIRPIVTERSSLLRESGQFVFEVASDSNKIEVKKAVEELFRVHVEKVRVVNVKAKPRRVRLAPGYTKSWKKAIVTLKQGESIPFFEGV
ncbi:MAG TPA: 50S ribosomal protein L23 [Candidatus Hydrothermia bacterium]|nr:50S ribosomal protein L23 [Candidatus Hydrothermae bacterium]MDD3648926.1 50S ribosomal protein L23 [Candidatus Hydrothermia bacterium]HRD22295.1 50S ribosomal protein L23 [Candidatus Hydrothermia bacterium]